MSKLFARRATCGEMNICRGRVSQKNVLTLFFESAPRHAPQERKRRSWVATKDIIHTYTTTYTGCQEIDVTLHFECKIIMSPVLVTLWCCPSMKAGQRLCFSERSLVQVCMCCCASSTGSFVRALIYQRLQCRYGEGVHLFDTVQGCGSTWRE